MADRRPAKHFDMEALSPRDVNAQPLQRVNELKTKAAAQLKATKEKEHPPPPPAHVPEPPSADRPDGAVYQVGKMLGKGGFAVCYEGVLAGTRKRYALKIVKSHMPAKMEQKFQTELQIHSKMKQQNIVQFLRAFSFENCTYLILELCPNGSLMDLVKRRKGITEPEVRFYSVQIAGAIKYMHGKGIIHRDLKMGNIFLDRQMNVKIGDFGLAALLVTGRDMQTIRRTTLCGTPNYIAPEILEKGRKGHDHMVDIWSLGIIMFAMFTSKPPFQSATTDEIYRRARERDYEWPTEGTSAKYISPEAKDLVAIMLQEADKRPEPDTIIEHPFFVAGYMPSPEQITSKLREGPPRDEEFYEVPMSPQTEIQSLRNLQSACHDCGIEPWNKTQVAHISTWKEVAAEEKAGLTPLIPLAEGIVYRPFDDWIKEQTGMSSLLKRQNLEQAPAEATLSSQKGPAGLLRAPPQSFAAQQRAQNRPANVPKTTRAPAPTAVETATRSTATVRSRAKKEPTVTTTPVEVAAAPPPLKRAASSTRQRLPISQTAPSLPAPDTAPKPAPVPKTVRRTATDEVPVSLFGPTEYQETVPGTQPGAVLERLRKLQAELERALNSRSMALLSAKDKTPLPPQIVVKWVDYTNKFGLGYILNDGSIGCILRNVPTNDGTKTTMLPPSCLLVHDAERHIQRRQEPTYSDRHQVVPMSEGIYFYENNGEAGFNRARVAPESFKLPANGDGTSGKLSAGKDIYDHRKRERIVLWKKFANYMMAYGRDQEGGSIDDADIRIPSIRDPSLPPSDLVTFYQRFGDVGCWVFCDGHLQFNFPDHTKIVLDSKGEWCHFWHLPQSAAERLANSGTLEESALDDRAVLSYPLQTLLNFSVAPKQPGSRTGTRTASTSRRRPEISPALQGIPAANDFRRKVDFIKNIVKEWVTNGGIGNSAMSRDGRLRWTGIRETKNVSIPQKHVWVTIGARWGDERLSAYVDPRKPAELGADIDESKKRTAREFT